MAPARTCECGTCQTCKHRACVAAYYLRNAEKVRARVRAARQRRLEEARAYDRARAQPARATPEQRRARRKVHTELSAGRLERQPCEVCGAEKVDAHHEDYSKPIEVRWLCRLHHGQAHQRVAREARAAS